MNKNLLLGISEVVRSFTVQIETIENKILRKLNVSEDLMAVAKYVDEFLPVDLNQVIVNLYSNKKTFEIKGFYQKYYNEKAIATFDVPLDWLFIDDIDQLLEAARPIFEKEKERASATRKVKEAFDNLMELEQAGKETITCLIRKG